MSNTTAAETVGVAEQSSSVFKDDRQQRWLQGLFSPLWLCLLLTIGVRVWLTIHTNGVIAGDEAMVGLQAEHILRGEHFVYYFAQPYMGSLQAYFMALIFFIAGGPSVWGLRVEAMCVALLLVYLTWRLAGALADEARLTSPIRTIFMTIVTLIAAFPPLYGMVEEMRARGGYTEAFTLMIWLLFCALRLTQRWRAQASIRELALRWAGIGFLIGLGFWVDPLVIYGVATSAAWLAGYILLQLLRPSRRNVAHPRLVLLKETFLAIVALPTILLGFAPGLYWGMYHQWENIKYIFQNGGGAASFADRLQTISGVGKLYLTCLAPRTMGGVIPTEPYVSAANPHVWTLNTGFTVACLVLCVVAIALSFLWRNTLFMRIRRMTLLPLLFVIFVSIVFCYASIAIGALYSGCSEWDLVGRYIVVLVTSWPFFIATVAILPLLIAQGKKQRGVEGEEPPSLTSQEPVMPVQPMPHLKPGLVIFQAGLVLLLLLYFGTQGRAYLRSDPGYTFQATGCPVLYPANNDPIIEYMRQEHIRYAWATGWLADPLTFKANETIIVTEPGGRIAANDAAVQRADRPSFLFLVRHDSMHPRFLQFLDEHGVTYRVARFFSEPGYDIMLVTPLNKNVSPFDQAFKKELKGVFDGCPV